DSGGLAFPHRNDGKLFELVYLVCTVERPFFGEPRSAEGLRQVELAGMAAGGIHQPPLVLLRPFSAAVAYLVEDGFAIGRDGLRVGTAQCGVVVQAKWMLLRRLAFGIGSGSVAQHNHCKQQSHFLHFFLSLPKPTKQSTGFMGPAQMPRE